MFKSQLTNWFKWFNGNTSVCRSRFFRMTLHVQFITFTILNNQMDIELELRMAPEIHTRVTSFHDYETSSWTLYFSKIFYRGNNDDFADQTFPLSQTKNSINRTNPHSLIFTIHCFVWRYVSVRYFCWLDEVNASCFLLEFRWNVYGEFVQFQGENVSDFFRRLYWANSGLSFCGGYRAVVCVSTE